MENLENQGNYLVFESEIRDKKSVEIEKNK